MATPSGCETDGGELGVAPTESHVNGPACTTFSSVFSATVDSSDCFAAFAWAAISSAFFRAIPRPSTMRQEKSTLSRIASKVGVSSGWSSVFQER